jgi:hypothetical protein
MFSLLNSKDNIAPNQLASDEIMVSLSIIA